MDLSPFSIASDDWNMDPADITALLHPDAPASSDVEDEDAESAVTVEVAEAEAPYPSTDFAEDPLIEITHEEVASFSYNQAGDSQSLRALDDRWRSLEHLEPLLSLLPAFKQVYGIFVLSGSINDVDVDRLLMNAQHVKNLTLASDEHGCSSQISPSVYIRLAQHLRSPLLPSLRRLQLPSVTTSLTYLSLFLSPSLQHLELSNIHLGAEHLVTAFLETLPCETPALNHLVLRGPLQLHPESVRPISQMKELRRLHLDGIVWFEDFHELVNVGTLPHLEDLILNLRDSYYESNGLPGMKGFRVLRTLRVTAPFLLIRDLLHHIASSDVQEIDLTPVVDFRHDPKAGLDSARLFDDARCRAEPPKEEEIEELVTTTVICRHNRMLTSCKKPKCKQARASYESTIVSAVMAPLPPVSKSIDWLSTFKQCIDVITSRWQGSMTLVGFNILDIDIETPGRVFELPEIIMQPLTQLHMLESLQISLWKVSSLDSILQHLISSWPTLKVLHLPLGEHSSGLRLTTLRTIADSCPLLHTLQACIDLTSIPLFHHSPLFHYSAPPKYTLQHGLRSLSVTSPASTELDSVQLLAVARQLNILFPYVAIETHLFENNGLWQQLHEILKMYQAVREDDRNRAIFEE